LDTVPIACDVERRDPQAPSSGNCVHAHAPATALKIIRAKRLTFFFDATFWEPAHYSAIIHYG
jgi:hypothetical protein